MPPEYYSDLGQKLDTLSKGDVIQLEYAKERGLGQQEEGTLRLVVMDPPNRGGGSRQPKRMSSVIQTVEADADLTKEYKELLDDGVRTVNIQSSRDHKQSRYEIRDLQNKDIDGADVQDVTVVGQKDVPE